MRCNSECSAAVQVQRGTGLHRNDKLLRGAPSAVSCNDGRVGFDATVKSSPQTGEVRRSRQRVQRNINEEID